MFEKLKKLIIRPEKLREKPQKKNTYVPLPNRIEDLDESYKSMMRELAKR